MFQIALHDLFRELKFQEVNEASLTGVRVWNMDTSEEIEDDYAGDNVEQDVSFYLPQQEIITYQIVLK